MNIKFLDKTTVVIKESMEWTPKRPKNKSMVTSNDIIAQFLENHKKYEIVSISGPNKICNFKDEKSSHGEWTLIVKKKNTRTPKTIVFEPKDKSSIKNKGKRGE
tara:strand:- start:120 stop:431 length:312 start_codon:yes stop_codon:yes gene_type:complete